MSVFVPVLVHPSGEPPRLGEPLIDEYLRFVAARASANTLLAQRFDLKVFFTVVGKEPLAVTTTDVLAFIEAQRLPRKGNVVRLADGESGLAASTIKRRLASIAGLFSYLFERGWWRRIRFRAARTTAAQTAPPRLATSRCGRPCADWRFRSGFVRYWCPV